ncbi:hypothetical protein [Spirosoma gilvum]
MIPLFPYWKFTLHSPLSQEEAYTRLSGEVAPIRQGLSLLWDNRPQAFTGSTSKNGFCIERIIHYKNSFLPTIYGRFLPTKTGLQIRIVMQLSPIILFIGIGLVCCALPILVSIAYGLLLTGHVNKALTIPSLLIVAIYVMFVGGFAYEAVTARRLLKSIFDSTTVGGNQF